MNLNRDWTEDFEYENGKYQSICADCLYTFVGHKRRTRCKACTNPASPRIRDLSDGPGQSDARSKELDVVIREAGRR